MEKGTYSTWIMISCLIGFLLSAYATYVEVNIEMDENYRALCDIGAQISCTKVFSSRYGKGFGLMGYVVGEKSALNQANGIFGVLYYIGIGLLSLINNRKAAKAQVVLCAVSNLLSLYLAYLLYYVLEDFCVVCVSTYVVNFANMMLSAKRYKIFRDEPLSLKSKKH